MQAAICLDFFANTLYVFIMSMTKKEPISSKTFALQVGQSLGKSILIQQNRNSLRGKLSVAIKVVSLD